MDKVNCFWNREGSPLVYGGMDYSESFESLPKDVAVGLQGIYGPNFLILWEAGTKLEGITDPVSEPEGPPAPEVPAEAPPIEEPPAEPPPVEDVPVVENPAG